MGIFRSTNPTEFDDIDGIIINEQNPPPSIAGVGANVAILVGQFQRGPLDLTSLGSIGELHELMGRSSYGGNLALKNKRFGALRVIRVAAAAAVSAFKAFQSTATDRITFTAKYKGVYGNSIKVTIDTGTTTGKKYTIQDTSVDAVLPAEVYDNVVITDITSATFAESKLVTVTVNSTAAEPTNAAATALATGSDGVVADSDYEAAIALAQVENAGNVMFLDSYNANRNLYLKTHALALKDKMVILCGPEVQTKAAAISDVAGYRSDYIVYAYPYVKTVIDGAEMVQNPASWVASVISQTSPHIDPAYAGNKDFLGGITGLKYSLTRTDHVDLNAAGVMCIEMDRDIGTKIKNGVTTEISSSAKKAVLRRRMASYLQDSIAYFLKQYQNAPNTKENRTEVKGAILGFIQRHERDGVLPGDDEVSGGKAKIVDTETLNTPSVIAQGYFKILYRQRIHSSMRFIELQAEIGEGVVVTEA